MQVVKLAQPGYDARTAGDENLIYSSLWPLLKVYKQGTHTVGDITAAATVAEHDLGFIPVFWYFSNAGLDAYSASGALVTTTRSEFFGPVGGGSLRMDGGKLAYSPSGVSMTGSLRLYYYIMALDLAKAYTAPIIRVGAVSGARGRRVLKLVKPGRKIDSESLDDFIVHSRARSPLVHSITPSGSVTKEFVVRHNLGYVPIFFGYTKNSDGSYSLIPTGQGGSSTFQSDEQTVRFTDSGGKEISILILKDPFQLEYSVQVSI